MKKNTFLLNILVYSFFISLFILFIFIFTPFIYIYSKILKSDIESENTFEE